jgi:hypothetical protein
VVVNCFLVSSLPPSPFSTPTNPQIALGVYLLDTMAADMSGEQMQAKITAARREAEGLKDKIKRRKDELADTTCKIFQSSPSQRKDGRLPSPSPPAICFGINHHIYSSY